MGDQSIKRNWSRRDFVSLLSSVPLLNSFGKDPGIRAIHAGKFPAKDEFDIKGTYLNSAYTHPMSKGSYREILQFLHSRMLDGQTGAGYDGFDRSESLQQFARLINADNNEIAWVPSTMVGENLIVNGLSLPGSRQKVVTDAFHFHGSLHLYNQWAKQGLKLKVVTPINNRIDLNDLDKAITPGT